MHPRVLRHRSPLFRFALPWLAALLALPLSAAPAYVTIGTGALNGVYYPTGGAICRLLNEESSQHGLHCTVQNTSGSLANLVALAKGDIQLALVQSDVLYHAAHGSGPFTGEAPNDKLRSLFRLHQESLTLLASATSNITTLADIEGKRVDLGNSDSGDRVTSQALLDAMGWQASSFAAAPAASASNPLEGLCNGSLDAAFVVAGHPNQGIGDLTGRCKARLIPIEGEQIDRLLKNHPYYQRSRIGANLYPGQTSGISTFAVTAELVALDSLPQEEVRTVRDVLSSRLKQFTRLHPALTTLTPESMQSDNIVLPHPGMQDAPAQAPLLAPESLSPSAAEGTAATPASDAAPSPEGAPARPEQGTGAVLPAGSGAVATDAATPALEGQVVPQGGTAMPGAPSAAPEQELLLPATPAAEPDRVPTQPSGAAPTAQPQPAGQ